MPSSSLTSEDIAQRGQELYDREIRAKVEPQNMGKFLILDVETGDYEIDESDMAALRRFKDKHPGAVFYIIRIGHSAAYRLGRRTLAPR